jgi:hypothetical protein
MPVTVIGNSSADSIRSLDPSIKYDYDYPEEIGNLQPNSETHQFIVNEVINKSFDSYRAMQKRHPAWKAIDRTLTAYIPLSDKERISQDADSTKPVNIVFPISYENMEVLTTYLSAALLGNPLMRYEGVDIGAGAAIKAALLELVIATQVRRGKAKMALQTFLRDAVVYGIAAAHLPYKVDKGFRTVRTPDFTEVAGVKIFSKQEGELEEFTIFEGTVIENIDPYKVLPDPDTPFHRQNEGGYFGWVHRTSVEAMLDMERSNPDFFFNTRYLLNISDTTSRVINVADGRGDKYDGTQIREGTYNRPVDIIWMYIRVIPSEWELGDSDYPERWLFGVAGDGIVVCAHKMGLDHNRNPIITSAPDTDGHGLNPVSKLEVIYGLQNVADFFFNTRSMNVRKALNDMFIIDPNIVNVASMKTTGAGKLMFLKRGQWGEGKIDSAIKQFPVADVTAGLPADINFVRDSAGRSTGSVDALLGIMQGGGRERVTATEAGALQQNALSRMEHMAQIVDEQAFGDMGDQFAYNTRQFMSEDTFVRITGRSAESLQNEFGVPVVRVTPQMIDTYWEVLANDGSIPGSGNAQTWIQLFQAVSSNEQLAPQFDITRIFKHIARIMGARNLDEFIAKGGANIRPQVLPDDVVSQQAQAGNVVPIEGGISLAA